MPLPTDPQMEGRAFGPYGPDRSGVQVDAFRISPADRHNAVPEFAVPDFEGMRLMNRMMARIAACSSARSSC
jgi:hypothetical protein